MNIKRIFDENVSIYSEEITARQFEAILNGHLQLRFNRPTKCPHPLEEKHRRAWGPYNNTHAFTERVIAPLVELIEPQCDISDCVDISVVQEGETVFLRISYKNAVALPYTDEYERDVFAIDIVSAENAAGQRRPFMARVTVLTSKDNCVVPEYSRSMDKPVFQLFREALAEMNAVLKKNIEIALIYMDDILALQREEVFDLDEQRARLRALAGTNGRPEGLENPFCFLAPVRFREETKKFAHVPPMLKIPLALSLETFSNSFAHMRSMRWLVKDYRDPMGGKESLLDLEQTIHVEKLEVYLSSEFDKSFYCIREDTPEPWLYEIVRKKYGKHLIESKYIKALFFSLLPTKISGDEGSAAIMASREEVQAIDNPGVWFAYDYKQAVITTGTFKAGADIPELDHNAVLVYKSN